MKRIGQRVFAAERPSLFYHLLVNLLLDRIDAWGVAFIVAGMAVALHQVVTMANLALLVAISLGYWFAYTLNDFWDREHDAVDAVKAARNVFLSYALPKALLYAIAGGIIGLLVMIFAGFGARGLLMLALCFLIMWAYSAPPLRLKSRPVLDLLTHGLFVQSFPYVIVLILNRLSWTTMDAWILAVNVLASMSGQLNQQLRDFAIDAQTDTNFTQRYGRETATPLMLSMVGLAAGLLLSGVGAGVIPLSVGLMYLAGVPHLLQRLYLPDAAAIRILTTYAPVLIVMGYTLILLGIV